MKSLRHTSFWFPNYIVESVLDIEAAELNRRGVTCMVFDLDDTLVPRGRSAPAQAYQELVQSLQESGFQVFIATNTRRDISRIEHELGVAVVRPAGFSMKPFASFYRRVIAKAGVGPQQIAMVGNHFVNDIIGANRAGLVTVLTKSVGR